MVEEVERPRYTAEILRDGRFWLIRVPELKGVFTQARNLTEVEEMTRDVIALMLQVSENSFDLEVVPVFPGEVGTQIREAVTLRRTADEAAASAAEATQQAVNSLLRTGVSIRDTGRLLGLSHQRVAQLAPRVRPRGRPRGGSTAAAG